MEAGKLKYNGRGFGVWTVVTTGQRIGDKIRYQVLETLTRTEKANVFSAEYQLIKISLDTE